MSCASPPVENLDRRRRDRDPVPGGQAIGYRAGRSGEETVRRATALVTVFLLLTGCGLVREEKVTHTVDYALTLQGDGALWGSSSTTATTATGSNNGSHCRSGSTGSSSRARRRGWPS
ncbi:hypothetical protein Prubr_56680 [Polymorphospora rubra]|uniref:Uncharacterized protein n=1 Tax=Polymorphospora rubra TaxID=338584 RepID=A0A810N5S1_9ACTN|nr:hypothetical protein Prubr_56680 [Polymorphospora rubra]